METTEINEDFADDEQTLFDGNIAGCPSVTNWENILGAIFKGVSAAAQSFFVCRGGRRWQWQPRHL